MTRLNSSFVAALAQTIRAWPLSAKVLGALAIALLPLGVLALSSVTAAYGELQRNEDRLARARLEAVRQAAVPRIEALVSTLRAAAVLGRDPDCRIGLSGLASTSPTLSDIALFDARGRLLCSGGGRSFPPALFVSAALDDRPDQVEALQDAATGDIVLRLRHPVGAGMVDVALGRVEPTALRRDLIQDHLIGPEDTARLLVGGRAVATAGSPPTARGARAAEPLMNSLVLEVRRPAPRLRLTQAFAVALPALMWLTALAICWVAIDRLVATPLQRIRVAVDRYGRGDRSIRALPAAGSTQELTEFARAFDAMADRADRHEADMQAALGRQTALTREVHHRVKNNLQIVSSLLSLQARDVDNSEVAAAYALIRQRVAALSLVHRWIYAGSAEAGVDLRGLLADLCANISNSFERADGGRLSVSCSSSQLVVHQDIALPIAFLVSELAANAVRLGATAFRTQVLEEAGAGILTITSDGFAGEGGTAAFEPASARIIQGLIRQLRGGLIHDPGGAFRIRFAAVKAIAAA